MATSQARGQIFVIVAIGVGVSIFMAAWTLHKEYGADPRGHTVSRELLEYGATQVTRYPETQSYTYSSQVYIRRFGWTPSTVEIYKVGRFLNARFDVGQPYAFRIRAATPGETQVWNALFGKVKRPDGS